MANLIFVWCLIFIFSEMGNKVETASPLPSGHLIGGRNAQIAMFPYQTSQRMKKGHYHFCGGAIITTKFVITAAHCICNIKYPMSSFYIWVGSTTLSGAGYKYDIEYSMCHSDFNTTTVVNDIGIIGVVKPFHFQYNVRPISIYMSEVQPGTMLTVSGWGMVSYPVNKNPDPLQKIQVPAISLNECKRQFSQSYTVVLSNNNICTFLPKNAIGTCRGDSGGPLTLKGKLVGLVSWGIPCASGKPDVFTKASSYKPWIIQTMIDYCRIMYCTTEDQTVIFAGGQ